MTSAVTLDFSFFFFEFSLCMYIAGESAYKKNPIFFFSVQILTLARVCIIETQTNVVKIEGKTKSD